MEDRTRKEITTRTLAISVRDWERIRRMATIQDRSTSSLIRSIVMPFVEQFEQINGLPQIDFDKV